jgi:small subunit ribosomal protein S2
MARVPSALWVVDTKKEHIAVSEARKLGIPVIAVLDTNCDPDEVDYPIPGNDDAIRSVSLLTRVVADAVADGLMARGGDADGEDKPTPTGELGSEEPLAEWERELLERKGTDNGAQVPEPRDGAAAAAPATAEPAGPAPAAAEAAAPAPVTAPEPAVAEAPAAPAPAVAEAPAAPAPAVAEAAAPDTAAAPEPAAAEAAAAAEPAAGEAAAPDTGTADAAAAREPAAPAAEDATTANGASAEAAAADGGPAVSAAEEAPAGDTVAAE